MKQFMDKEKQLVGIILLSIYSRISYLIFISTIKKKQTERKKSQNSFIYRIEKQKNVREIAFKLSRRVQSTVASMVPS